MSSQTEIKTPFEEKSENFDAVIVGAGFAGMYIFCINVGRLGYPCECLKLVRVLEALGIGTDTGARCDVESVQYSYQFDS